MKYKTIMADPPWMERGGGKIKRGADRHYPLMKTKDIAAMKDMISEIRDPDGCHLYLWSTNNFLKDAMFVMEEWGFKYITVITWVKIGSPGLGQYFRGKTEQLLFGRYGKVPYKINPDTGKRCQETTAFEAAREIHSKKPSKAFKMAENVSFGPRIELFSRMPREGWDVWGNEVESDVNYETR